MHFPYNLGTQWDPKKLGMPRSELTNENGNPDYIEVKTTKNSEINVINLDIRRAAS